MRKIFFKVTRLLRRAYLNRYRIVIGKNPHLGKHAQFDSGTKGRISIGNNFWIGDFSKLITHDGTIDIGDNCFIGHFTILYGHGGLRIGNNVMIAGHTVIVPANHRIDNPHAPINTQGISCRGINIEDDCWIGANVTVLDGVTIRRGAVVGAGSVVVKNVEPYSVVVGNPAKHIKFRNTSG